MLDLLSKAAQSTASPEETYNRGLLACVGVYAEVVEPGRVIVGDSVRVMAH